MNKNQSFKWGLNSYEVYTPKKNKKRLSVLGALIILDLILPLTFGVGIMLSNLIIKLNPMWLYK